MECPKRRRDAEAAASGLPAIPDDPLVEILSRVPAKSLCRWKCVSKAWRDLIAELPQLPQALEGFFFMVRLHECHDEGEFFSMPCACNGGDGEPKGDVDCDGEELSRYGFVDVLHRSVRLVDFWLTELPGIANSRLAHCCNGLLLFAVKASWGYDWRYVVYNPATYESVCVPSSGSGVSQRDTFYGGNNAATYLLFDPAGDSCHFNLVQFAGERYRKSVHVYSSRTEAWSDNKPELACYDLAPDHYPSVCVNGMLYLLLELKEKLLVLDVEGNIQKIIPLPCQDGRRKWTTFDCIGWSQGCLHYISTETDWGPWNLQDGGRAGAWSSSWSMGEPSFRGFLIWVLEDYERQQWVLKYTVSFSKLFGEMNVDEQIQCNYKVLGVHPYGSLVFLVQLWDEKVISYNMDTKEVRDLCTLEHGYECITDPYVPCFSELLTLDDEQ